jgi:lysozyme family protein
VSRLSTCISIVLGNEGGKVDHKSDRGGRTNFGITQKTYDVFCVMTGRTRRDVFDISEAEVEMIYGAYWKDAKCDRCPEPLDLMVFDCAINSGAGRAIKILQRALAIDEDGLFGNGTLDAMREEIMATSVEHLCELYLQVRKDFFMRIVERDPSQACFIDGWLNRIEHLREFV